MNFKVGDMVRVKDDLEVDEYYGGAYFPDSMIGYIGNTYEVEEVDEMYDTYILKDCNRWEFTDAMLESAKQESETTKSPVTKIEEILTPQSFESNDGRFRVEVCDDGSLELTMTDLTCEEKGYMDKEDDWVQKLEFDVKDLQRLIDILVKAKEINAYSLRSLREKMEEK